MFLVSLNRKALDGWALGISKRFRKNLEVAQGQIRQEWQAELYRQSNTAGDGNWAPLGPVYKERRDKKYPELEGTMLRRTGEMLEGYVDSITFYTTNTEVSVVMYYPQRNSKVLQRALENQGEEENPHVPARPFDIGKFQDIAIARFNEAMKKSSD